MLKLTNVHKSLGGRPVLNSFSLEVPDGESVALLGLSGSGKTTVLKSICGLLLPDLGEVSIDGTVMSAATRTQLRRKLGYVVQDGGLFPHLTLRENLSLIGREVGLSETSIREKTSELAKLTQLTGPLLDRYPREVSGGQRQRVGLMRALFLDPSYLLLDEPLGALDPITRRELQGELKELFRRLQKTVILVTHDLFEATELGDRLVLLNEGRIVQSGQMQDFQTAPQSEFVRRFVGAQDFQRKARP